MKRTFIASLVLFSSAAYPAIFEYNAPEILARANINDGYNLPPMSFLSNTSPVINSKGEVAFKIMSVEGGNSQAIWMKSELDPKGKIIYVAPDERYLTDPSLNDTGKIAFNMYDDGVTDGLFLLDSRSGEALQVVRPDQYPIQYYTYPKVLNNDHIFFRATNDSSDRIYYEFNGKKLNRIIAEGIETSGVKSSYLFRPSVNDSGALAFKARLGERGQWDESSPDAIFMITQSTDPKSPGNILTAIARDKDFDSKSNYLGFGNSVSLSKNGLVAFAATTLEKKKSIVLFKDNVLKTVALEGQNGLVEIETFAPVVNGMGQVLFRAKDANGMRGLYLADETSVKKIIAEGDIVNTDLGPGKILSNPNYPGFGGELDMNEEGDIVFYCLIVSEPDNKELGSAVYRISPKR